jgi:endoglucanase
MIGNGRNSAMKRFEPSRPHTSSWLLGLLACVCLANGSLYGASRQLKPFEITVYSSSERSGGYAARNVINNRGIVGSLHDSLPHHSWQSLAENKTHPGTAAGNAWIKFRFDQEKPLEAIHLWNDHHEPQNSLREIVIQASVDNQEWQLVRKLTLPKGDREILNGPSAVIPCHGLTARYIIITAVSKHGNGPIYSLGEAKFLVREEAQRMVSPLADSIPEPNLTLEPKRSIAIDRSFPGSIPPENPLFKPADIKRIKDMGFDSVKFLLNPYAVMDGSNLINSDYIKKSVNTVIENGLPCIVCIHPPRGFKGVYFSDKDEFRKLCLWYENIAAFLAENWNEKQIVFQMMTEPSGASTDPDAWNYFNTLQHRIWAAIRRKLPQEYTIILGGDESGYLEALYFITPVEDPNVMYSFTHHVPHVFAFHGSKMSKGRHYDQVSGLAWPADLDITEEGINATVTKVPEEFKERIRREVKTYHATEWGYNHQYTLMKSLRDWSAYWGGKLKIICVEVGCVDNIGESRYRFMEDLRKAMEENDIGWIYWAYNRTQFTVYLPGKNKPFLGYRPGEIPFLGDPNKEPTDEKMLNALFSE